MKKISLRTGRIAIFFAVSASLIMLPGAEAAGEMVRQGIKACPGAHFVRNVSGTLEGHDAFYVLRNYNDEQTITITQVRAWDRYGTMIWDSEVDGFPTGEAMVLGPHQGEVFRASTLTGGAPLPSGASVVIQVQISYSLDRRGLPLHSGVVRFARVNGLEAFRFPAACRDK